MKGERMKAESKHVLPSANNQKTLSAKKSLSNSTEDMTNWPFSSMADPPIYFTWIASRGRPGNFRKTRLQHSGIGSPLSIFTALDGSGNCQLIATSTTTNTEVPRSACFLESAEHSHTRFAHSSLYH